MPSPSESQPLLSNGELPTSSSAAHNGEAVGSATEAPSKPLSQRLQRLRGSLSNLQHRALSGLRSSCASPTSETYVGIALCAGVVCGGVAFLYSSAFEALLDLVWTKVPENLLLPALERLHKAHSWWPAPGHIGWVYTVAASTLMGTLAGTVQAVMGFPGDLPDTVECIHHKGFVPIQQAPSMFLCSSFSIAAGGSLGPEAPLLALCAASTSWLGRAVLGYDGARLRNCALIGMAAGLAAFFGVSLGGSLFALEVLHRAGMQFYEMATFAVLAGLVCLLIFRGLAGIPYGPIWDWEQYISAVDYRHILLGGVGGLIGAAMALFFMQLHRTLKRASHAVGLHEHKTPVLSGAIGGFLIGVIGVLLPPTMFWGEYEMNTLANFDNPLPHIWPKGGIWGLHPFLQGHYSIGILVAVAFAKLVAISITVLAGFRGGFIFPIFLAGTALGRGLAQVPGIPFVSGVPPVLLSMTLAAGVDVAITRTPFATPLILTTLSGHPEVMVPSLCSSLVSLFLTSHFPFILPQQDRRDVDFKTVSYELDVDAEEIEERADEHPSEVDF